VVRKDPDGATLAISGTLSLETAAAARREARAALSTTRDSALEIDASGIDGGDMSGMSVIYELAEGRLGPGVRATVRDSSPSSGSARRASESRRHREPRAGSRRRSFFGELGAGVIAIAGDLRQQLTFLGATIQAVAAALRRPRTLRWPEVLVVVEKAGVNAVPIVSLISLLTGVIIAYEVSQPLSMFGARAFTADIIGIVMVREFSPIFTAIVLAGRSGSAFAAEIGTMKVNEELDALTTMGLEPMRFLLVQRVLAGTLLMPALTAFSMLAGVFGGVVVHDGDGIPVRTDLVSPVQLGARRGRPRRHVSRRSHSVRSCRDSGVFAASRRRRARAPSATRPRGRSCREFS
jgi:phospholipid/cholesterol/gamma-HCH transport system permease protein